MTTILSMAIDILLLTAILLQSRKINRLESECLNYRNNFDKRITDLEGGVVPDYEKSKEAAKAVNDFSAGLVGILGFDPITALHKNDITD